MFQKGLGRRNLCVMLMNMALVQMVGYWLLVVKIKLFVYGVQVGPGN
jgi:hypothetical protein